MNQIRTEIKKRAYDGMYVKWGLVPHPSFQAELWNVNAQWFPQIWVPLSVTEEYPR